MRLSTSAKAALGILLALIAYFGFRALTHRPAAETEAVTETLFSVLVETVSPQEWQDTVRVRGRTAAERKVTVRAETAGVVEATPTAQGVSVKQGDVLCRLRVDARRASLQEAQAAYTKAKLDYDAGLKLAAEGFRSDTSVAGLKAALDLASAGVEQARVALARTTMTAPFDGVFDSRAVEVGAYMNIGDPCGVVIERSPFLIVGAVSERDVGKIAKGDPGTARLVTGETLEGVVRFVAASAEPSTRTFTVELEVDNTEGKLRDGVTAEFEIRARRREAYRIARSSLTLDDAGVIGVRLIADDDTVAFAPVTLIGETPEGIWITGLKGTARVISRGQEFVSVGQRVRIAAPAGDAS